MPLYRGNYRLPHQCQVIGRDEDARTILASAGGSAFAVMLTERDHYERATTGKGGPPYRYIVRSPRSCSLAWTAFYEREDLADFVEAYGLKLDREPTPGESFSVLLPSDESAFLPLVRANRVRQRSYGLPNRAWLEVDAPHEIEALQAARTHYDGPLQLVTKPAYLGENLYRFELQ